MPKQPMTIEVGLTCTVDDCHYTKECRCNVKRRINMIKPKVTIKHRKEDRYVIECKTFKEVENGNRKMS